MACSFTAEIITASVGIRQCEALSHFVDDVESVQARILTPALPNYPIHCATHAHFTFAGRHALLCIASWAPP